MIGEKNNMENEKKQLLEYKKKLLLLDENERKYRDLYLKKYKREKFMVQLLDIHLLINHI